MVMYLDTNVFYNAYCPIEDRIEADWILNQLSSEFQGLTSEWTIVEMFRAFKKQVNLDRIEEKDAQIALNLFLSEIGEYSQKKQIILVPVKMAFIVAARPIIFERNLYAADAIHVITAIQSKASVFITFDKDFEKFESIPVLNPNQSNFRQEVKSFLKQQHLD
ncbi:MAG: type II toxin-antitoxin system VapC family toxin [Candidatus Lokiarchaeota archaeon]|nr:type II toxin-antitoxin system VapC family toxin [Candidatus Lokiarchaeota archaeon]